VKGRLTSAFPTRRAFRCDRRVSRRGVVAPACRAHFVIDDAVKAESPSQPAGAFFRDAPAYCVRTDAVTTRHQCTSGA
jgi:hypothetical protein